MTNTNQPSLERVSQASLHAALEERFSRRLVLRLSESVDQIDHHACERLKAARHSAVEKRKVSRRSIVGAALVELSEHSVWGNALAWCGIFNGLFFGPHGRPRLQAALCAAPLVAFVIAMMFVANAANENEAVEKASVDIEILTDQLPPSAYLDNGFIQFVKVSN